MTETPDASAGGALYETPWDKPELGDCTFYHAMTFPSGEEVAGHWDLRGRFDDYLGGADFSGKRVLDIGPASGWLAFNMEMRGADVTVAEVDSAVRYRGVPYHNRPATRDRPRYQAQREAALQKMKNSFWYAWHEHSSRVRVHYGDLYELPDALGEFDTSLLAAVITHNRDPIGLIESAARRTREAIIITEAFAKGAGAFAQIVPDANSANKTENWFTFSLGGLRKVLEVMGFSIEHTATNAYPVPVMNRDLAMTTVVAKRVAGSTW